MSKCVERFKNKIKENQNRKNKTEKSTSEEKKQTIKAKLEGSFP